jgi:hypothetical protein
MLGKDFIYRLSDSVNDLANVSNLSVKRFLFHLIWSIIISILIITSLFSKFFDFQTSRNPLYLIYGSLGVFYVLMLISIFTRVKKIFPLILLVLMIFSGLTIIYTYLFQTITISSLEYFYGIGTFLIYLIGFSLIVYLKKS